MVLVLNIVFYISKAFCVVSFRENPTRTGAQFGLSKNNYSVFILHILLSPYLVPSTVCLRDSFLIWGGKEVSPRGLLFFECF